MISYPAPRKCCVGHGAEVSGIGGGATVGLLAPLAGLGVVIAHGRLPRRVVAQKAVERIRKQ